MARIPLEETPIYAQLLQERSAALAYDLFFGDSTAMTSNFAVTPSEIRLIEAKDER